MERYVHDSIIGLIESRNHWDFEECLKVLQQKHPDEAEVTLKSIISQTYQKRVKKSFYVFNSKSKRKEIYDMYLKQVQKKMQDVPPGIVVSMAKKMFYSPFLLCKIIVEEWYSRRSDNPLTKSGITRFMKKPHLIDDVILACEVEKANANDFLYGHIAEAIKHSYGHEHEQLLMKKLDDLNIIYQDEKTLKNVLLCDKTPDIKLVIPFAVDGIVVNWIESKALFGDEDVHANYLKDQLLSYWNRFGPGIVIYWCGFVKVIKNLKKYEGILVKSDFPAKEDIEYYDYDYGKILNSDWLANEEVEEEDEDISLEEGHSDEEDEEDTSRFECDRLEESDKEEGITKHLEELNLQGNVEESTGFGKPQRSLKENANLIMPKRKNERNSVTDEQEHL